MYTGWSIHAGFGGFLRGIVYNLLPSYIGDERHILGVRTREFVG